MRWLALFLTLYLALCSVGGVYLADGTLHLPHRALTSEETLALKQWLAAEHASLENVSITAADGVVLGGWLVHPAQPNGDAAVLLHGMGDNRLGMIGYAKLLVGHGYAALLPDARAHGLSDGEIATYGLVERYDVRQWVEFLSNRTSHRCVYGMGESMGAAQLLQSLQVGTRLCAVVAESPFASFREIAYHRMGQPFHLGPWVGRFVLRPLVEIAFLRARWKYKLDISQVSPDGALAGSNVPVLLIHGQIDNNIPVRHSRLIRAHHPEATLWEVPGADHCGAMLVAPEEFDRRVLDWFSNSARLTPVTAR